MMNLKTLTALLLASLGTLPAADLKLGALFSDHMVLQRDMPVPVWGTGTPGEAVIVTIAGQSKSGVTGAEGRWRVVLDPLKTGAAETLVVKGKTTLTIHEVQIGDVWLCAGDAAMARSVKDTPSTRGEKAVKSFPAVRWFHATTLSAKEPQADVSGMWTACEATTVGDFPALAYLFASELNAATQVPIGIIEVTDLSPTSIQRAGRVSGSTAEAWISEPTLLATPAALPILDFYKSPNELREAMTAYQDALGDWKLKNGKALGAELRELEKREPDVWYDYVAEMKKAGKAAPPAPPQKPTAESLRMASTHAANLYNGMIAPLAGSAIRGVALSLGAANAARAVQYRSLFPALIKDWRKAWSRDDLPVVFVQQERASSSSMDPRAWAELREAQAMATTLPKTGMVPSMDLPMTYLPHTEDVKSLSKRLAAAARSVAYGEKANFSGPVIESVRFEGDKAIVQFRAGSGPLSIRSGDELKGFALAERPNRWVYAQAKIDGDRVIVSNAKLKAPAALRYDWIMEAGLEGNLTNADGQPAQPFRSDDWQALTDSTAGLKPNASAPMQPTDLYPVTDPSLPRVLLIGDSIMNGYSPYVTEALRGKANVVRLVAFGLVAQKPEGVAQTVDKQMKLKDGDYAVIHYNDGLHSLPPRISDEQYGIGLKAALIKLKEASPKVIWATTTPAPDKDNTLGPESSNGAVITRNAMSKQISAELGVEVNDLYELVIGRREQLQGFANLHFTPEGSKAMGEQIAARILAALNSAGPAK